MKFFFLAENLRGHQVGNSTLTAGAWLGKPTGRLSDCRRKIETPYSFKWCKPAAIVLK
jgi:hypothetical protein